MVPMLPWGPWPSDFEVQKNDSLALIIEIHYLKQNFFEADSCLLALTTSTSHMQSCSKIDGAYLGKDSSICPGFQDSYCSNLQLVVCKRFTLSAPSIFVTEGLFIYIYFLLLEENHQNRISRVGEKNSPKISLFFRKMIA